MNDLHSRYGRALLSLVSRHRDGAPDLSSVPAGAIEALTAAARAGREIPEPPGETDPTISRVTFSRCRFETVQGADGEEKRFAVASFRAYGGDVVTRYRINWDKLEYERYEMVLEMGDANVDLSRFNSGAPFLNAHNSWAMEDVLGVIVDGSGQLRASEDEGIDRELVADVRFSRRESVQPVVTDVFDGITRQVSQGFDILADQWEERKDNVPLRRITKWSPHEVSLVPMGAAGSAQIFAAVLDRTDRTPNTALGALSARQQKQEEAMGQNAGTAPTAPTAGQKTEAELLAEGARLENERQDGLRTTARILRLSVDDDAVEAIVKNTKVSLDAGRARLIEMAAARDDANPAPPAGSVAFGVEESEKIGAAMVRGLLHRFDPGRHKIEDREDPARQYANASLIELAREALARSGVDVRFAGPGEVAERAMRLRSEHRFSGGGHTTSDFPLLLADAAGKSLRAAYKLQPQKWRPLVRVVNLPDLKDRKVHQMGEMPSLAEVAQGGEYTYATFSEGKVTWHLVKYGKKFRITEEVLINDDLDAFTRLPAMFGAASARTEANVVWAIFTSNPTMPDSVALFHASHGNLASVHVGAPDADSLSEAREALAMQTGLDDEDDLDIEARYLVAGPQYATAIDQLIVQTTPSQTSHVVPGWIRDLTPIIVPKLDRNSGTSWFVTADPSQIDTIEAGWLQGQEGVQISTRDDWDHDALEIKAKLRFGASAIDHRGVFKNAGA